MKKKKLSKISLLLHRINLHTGSKSAEFCDENYCTVKPNLSPNNPPGQKQKKKNHYFISSDILHRADKPLTIT